MTVQKKKGSSGEHPAVRTFRKKLDSIAETTVPLIAEVNERLDRMRSRTPVPPKDPRRDGGSNPPDDIVELVELDDPGKLSSDPPEEKP